MPRYKRKIAIFSDNDDKQVIIDNLKAELESYFQLIGVEHNEIETKIDHCQKMIIVQATYQS